MRNHQQCPPEDATIAKLGDATFVRLDTTDCPWNEKDDHEWQNTTKLIRYGATFWKKVVPEPGYRLVEDHERVVEKPEGCRTYGLCCSIRQWHTSCHDTMWHDDYTYAVPIKQVVAWKGMGDGPETMYVATFANQEDRDRAVREANERER